MLNVGISYGNRREKTMIRNEVKIDIILLVRNRGEIL